MIRALIADDHELFRMGLRGLLEQTDDIMVVAEATNGEEVMAEARACHADVVVLDLSMPGRGAFDTIRDLKASHPEIRVLVLTVSPEEQYAVRSLREGADGYLTKDAGPEVVVQALRKVAAGGKYLSPTLGELVAEVATAHDRPGSEVHSSRELAVLQELAAGHTLPEIAAHLHLNVTTVRAYRAYLLQRLHLRSTAELMVYAVRGRPHQVT